MPQTINQSMRPNAKAFSSQKSSLQEKSFLNQGLSTYLCEPEPEPEHVDHEAMQEGIILENLNALSLGNFV